MRTLALDPGERRIGVAITDATGTLAQPLETIETRGLLHDSGLKRIGQIVDKYGVGNIVIGLPLHMDGREGEQASAVRKLGSRLAETLPVEVEYLDERWSTLEAQRSLRETAPGRSRSKGRKRDRGRVDRVAAALLLSTWLERSRR